jgi:hypothetical protein
MSRHTFGRRINEWLHERPGEVFRYGKWRFWFPALIGLSILNAILTAMIFRAAGNLETNMGAVLLGVGALLAWLGVGALHYSDSSDARLSRGVAILDSITLLFVAAHFSFCLWVYGHLITLQKAEAQYRTDIEKFNAEAKAVNESNAKIAEALDRAAAAQKERAKIEADTAYQLRKAAERGARIKRDSGGITANISMAPVELAKPPAPPKDSSTDYLTRWDSSIRLANFGELALAIFTLIFIRIRSSRTNSPRDEDFPSEIDADVVRDDRTGRRLDRTRKSDSERQSLISGDSGTRKAALKLLREHLKQIAFYHPGLWFKADLIHGGVTIRLFKRDHGHEIMVARTDQSDKLLAAVDRPDFRDRLLGELIYQGFPLS